MDLILKELKDRWVGIVITASSILLISVFHWLGLFDVLEMKSYDYRFHRVRGPLTGWTAKDSTYIKRDTDVVLIEVDDEAWRLVPEAWPYPRGTIWGRAIKNLYRAGAKVIVFDIQFDAPETKSEYLHTFADNIQSEDLKQLIPRHGDIMLGEAISEAKAFGTEVIMPVKMVTEQNLQPPQYIAYPVGPIMAANPETGIINDMLDEDGFSRQYSIFDQMSHEPDKYYLTIGVKAVKSFLEISDSALPKFDADDLTCNYGHITIKTYGYGNTFLVNYYGPPSGYRLRGSQQLPSWGTFPRYSLAYIIDTEEVTLRDPTEDIDWMSQFIPGVVPEWISAIEDPIEKQEMMNMMGIGEKFDITKSPFYNKIVVIGTAVEVHHDVKNTPFYNYMGVQQLTPGMETHANAIQTILDNNYLNVLGGRLTGLFYYDYPMSHTWLIGLLCLIAFVLLSFFNPVVAGVFILLEGIVYFGIVGGLFTDDLFWFLKFSLSSIFPTGFVANNASWFTVPLPKPGTSIVLPLVAPLAAVLITYTGNVIYKFLVEQKDKRFLKSTFGAYISPDLIDQMYAEKQEPKLGGDAGYHTAFFSDIQSFSAFSEVLEPERMVALMNEYLTEMTNVLLDRQGTLDKYIGDAIVAFYGAPVPVDDHEYQACMTALDMETKLIELRKKWESEGDWPDIVHNMHHRVGLNSGDMVTGNMGSAMRMNYTMMGDTVNIAARLEASAKQYGVYIQVAENTYKKVKDQFEWRNLDYVQVKGKNVPVKVYELLAEKGKLKENDVELVKKYEEGLTFYNKQEWDKALKKFEQSKELEDMFPTRPTSPSHMYIMRCNHLKENPPGADWNGVWKLTAK
ncbi:MAG: CHASE2 domain-containing protein [Candidatus Marinimicrobia bacterium]|jgi:adenylate cyclase|nr:CHASE2 domain-containing protein [Candidatus Neomarinimicrobiota bacterium]MBT3829478.1 CHASE2 domain-containing protein [Candidatus Neomarinimicrobiota bacterium]